MAVMSLLVHELHVNSLWDEISRLTRGSWGSEGPGKTMRVVMAGPPADASAAINRVPFIFHHDKFDAQATLRIYPKGAPKR